MSEPGDPLKSPSKSPPLRDVLFDPPSPPPPRPPSDKKPCRHGVLAMIDGSPTCKLCGKRGAIPL